MQFTKFYMRSQINLPIFIIKKYIAPQLDFFLNVMKDLNLKYI